MICIVTEYIFPPIPDRRFDWIAYDQDSPEDGPRGWGRTQEEAIEGLLYEYEYRL